MVLMMIPGFLPRDGGRDFQDARGCPRMVLRIILTIFSGLARVSSRMLEDGSRMPQDGLKDHPGDFSWIGASELQDARG